MERPQKITWADLLLAAAVLLTAVGLLWYFSTGEAGKQVAVTVADRQYRLSLSEDTVQDFAGQNGHTVTVVIQNGTVRVSKATCPDKLCVHSGTLSRAGQTAACVPAGVVLRILGETEVDAVAE